MIDSWCHFLSMTDRQIETVRGADQYQLLKINVRNSYPVDLLTPGFQFETIERNVFRCSQVSRLRSSVLSRRGINSNNGEPRGSRQDGRSRMRYWRIDDCKDTRQERKRTREKRETQRGGRRNRAAASGRSVVAHHGAAGTHVQQVKGRYRAPRLFSGI